MRARMSVRLGSLVLPALLSGCLLYVDEQLAGLGLEDDLSGDAGKRPAGDDGGGGDGGGGGDDAGGGGGGGGGGNDAGSGGNDGGDGSDGGGGTPSSCEATERIVVLSGDGDEPLRYYRPITGGVVRVLPSGYGDGSGAALENPLPDQSVEELKGFTLLGERFYLVDGDSTYAVDPATLTQVDVRGSGERVVRQLGSPVQTAVTGVGRWLVPTGFSMVGIDLAAPFAAPTDELANANHYYHPSSIAFSYGATDYLAANHEDGYVVLSAVGEIAPSSMVDVDDEGVFGDYGPSTMRRGIAFDDESGALLLGNLNEVVLVYADDGFALGARERWEIPGADDFSEISVPAIAARDGFAYVLTSRTHTQNLFKLDLSTRPPTLVTAAQWSVGSETGVVRSAAVGCARLVVGLSTSGAAVRSFDLDDLSMIGSGPAVPTVRQVMVVHRDDVAIEGDE